MGGKKYFENMLKKKKNHEIHRISRNFNELYRALPLFQANSHPCTNVLCCYL